MYMVDLTKKGYLSWIEITFFNLLY